jgi:hypothetical protein
MTEHWCSQAMRLQNTVEMPQEQIDHDDNDPHSDTANVKPPSGPFTFSVVREGGGGENNHNSSTILQQGLPLIANNFTSRIVTGISDIRTMSLHPSTRHISVTFIFRCGGIFKTLIPTVCTKNKWSSFTFGETQIFITMSTTVSFCFLTSEDRRIQFIPSNFISLLRFTLLLSHIYASVFQVFSFL